jgi:hypothetical protein
VHGSAIAILIGLGLAYYGGVLTGKQSGLADISLFSGIGLMGGAMLRDFAIVATAFEVQVTEARKAGLIGACSLLLGTVLPFIVGASIAHAFGYRDVVSMTTIGAGAITYIVGPVTGRGAGCQLGRDGAQHCHRSAQGHHGDGGHAVCRPFPGPEQSALGHGVRRAGRHGQRCFGWPCRHRPPTGAYGALVATFHTGLGCLLGPSALYLVTKAIMA